MLQCLIDAYTPASMPQGSSTSPATVERVRKEASGARSVLVLLDSGHHAAHVAEEMVSNAVWAQSARASAGSYAGTEWGPADGATQCMYVDVGVVQLQHQQARQAMHEGHAKCSAQCRIVAAHGCTP